MHGMHEVRGSIPLVSTNSKIDTSVHLELRYFFICPFFLRLFVI